MALEAFVPEIQPGHDEPGRRERGHIGLQLDTISGDVDLEFRPDLNGRARRHREVLTANIIQLVIPDDDEVVVRKARDRWRDLVLGQQGIDREFAADIGKADHLFPRFGSTSGITSPTVNAEIDGAADRDSRPGRTFDAARQA